MRLLRRRKRSKPDPEFGTTHRYVGPTTTWGLRAGAACVMSGGGRRRGGLVGIRTTDGKTWKVPATQVRKRNEDGS